MCRQFGITTLLAAVVTVASTAAAGGGGRAESARTLLVHVSSPGVDTYGSGAWISKGRVLTASHLFLGVKADEPFSIKVISDGVAREARLSRIEDPAVLDLALLTVEDAPARVGVWAVSPVKVCRTPLRPAEPVIAAIQLTQGQPLAIETHASPDRMTWRNGVASVTALTAFLPHGASGGAVYHAERKCLVGVISQQEILRVEPVSLYFTNFVPASEIVGFLTP